MFKRRDEQRLAELGILPFQLVKVATSVRLTTYEQTNRLTFPRNWELKSDHGLNGWNRPFIPGLRESAALFARWPGGLSTAVGLFGRGR